MFKIKGGFGLSFFTLNYAHVIIIIKKKKNSLPELTYLNLNKAVGKARTPSPKYK